MFRYDNEPTSFLTHFLGFLFSITALALLVVSSSAYGTALHVVGFTIFGVSLVLLYGSSSIYHLVPKESAWKGRLQIVDHSMIFILIAGTYTPIALITLSGPWGWSLFGVVWGITLLGIIGKAIEDLRRRVPHWIFVALYGITGWIAIAAIVPLVHAFSRPALALLFTGGGLYTIGIAFFALDHVVPRTKWLGMHEVWHLFVLAGSACHFALIYRYLLPTLS
ncbi:MAG: hemolysin III family protein [Candidatus Paceibacterota bacterium]|jgi:hemolysin III